MQSPHTPEKRSCPLVSVGMPVYNGAEYLESAIKSILQQSNTDFELIISDNASDDGTEAICRKFARADTRIRYYRNAENIGAAANYNSLLELARGEYFRWSNADDLISPKLHELCLKALVENPRAVLSYGKTDIIDEHGNTTTHYRDNLHLPQRSANQRFRRFFDQVGLTNAIYGLMRTEAVRQTSAFGDGSLPVADVAFMAELTLQGCFVEIPEVLFFRRMHSGAFSFDRNDEERQQKFWRAEPKPFRLPVLRQDLRYLRRVWEAAIPIRERLQLSAYIMRRLIWQRRKIVSDFIDLCRYRTRSL